MADLFISYSREDSERAGQVAQGMVAAGFDVFWDTDVPPGQTWADYIEEKLSNCAAVIVLWSQHSTKSQWVREEARMGREKGKLIPASLDSSVPPFGFGEVQAANLSTWNGQMQGHADWDRLVGAVHNAIARAKGGEVSPPKPPDGPVPPKTAAPPPLPRTVGAPAGPAPTAPPMARGGLPQSWLIGGAVALAVGAGVYFYMQQQNRAAPMQQVAGVQSPVAPPPQVQQPVQQPMYQTPVAPPVAPPQGVSMEQYTQYVNGRMTQFRDGALREGFQEMGTPFNNQLNTGQTYQIPVPLNGGVTYRFVGVCDQDCADMDLRLRDANNNVVQEDTATDNWPILNLQAPASGPYTLDVVMYQCSQQPCFYSVALFARQ